MLPHGHENGFVLRDGAAAGAAADKKPLPFQLRQGALHGVGIYLRLGCQFPNGGNLAAGGQFAFQNRAADGCHDLLIYRAITGKFPIHKHLLICTTVLVH